MRLNIAHNHALGWAVISRCIMRSRGSVPIAESISANRTKSIATRFRAIFRWTGGASSRHGSHDPSVQTVVARSRFDLIPQFYNNRIDTILHFYYSRNVQAGDEGFHSPRSSRMGTRRSCKTDIGSGRKGKREV